MAYCTFQLGEAARVSGKLDLAIRLYQKGQNQFGTLGDRFYVGRTLRGLTFTFSLRPRPNVEIHSRLSQELLELTRDIGDRTGMAHAIYYLSIAEYLRANYVEVEQLLSEAQATWQEMGDRKSVAWMSNLQALFLFSSGDFERAEAMAKENLIVGSDINYVPLRNFAYALLSRAAAMREDYATAQLRARGVKIDGLSLDACACVPAFLEASIAEVGLTNFAAAWHSLYEALRLAYDFSAELEILTCLPVAVALLAHDGQKMRAVELLGLALSRPPSLVGWMKKWPLLTRLRANLETELGEEDFAAPRSISAR
jgi:hypothetical protein